jgi:hypothetical protein
VLYEDNETIILNNPDLSDEELEKVFAIKALIHNRNAVLQNVMAWEKFCFAVNDIIPDPEAVDIPNVLMVAYAVKKAEEVLHTKLLFEEPADHSTIVYIANIAFYDGWVLLPTILSFAQHQLDKLTTPYGKQLFHNITVKELSEREPWNDDDPVSNHCAKMQTLIEYLKIMDKQ